MGDEDKVVFHNPNGMTYIHWEKNGNRNIKEVPTGIKDARGGHAELDQAGYPLWTPRDL